MQTEAYIFDLVQGVQNLLDEMAALPCIQEFESPQAFMHFQPSTPNPGTQASGAPSGPPLHTMPSAPQPSMPSAPLHPGIQASRVQVSGPPQPGAPPPAGVQAGPGGVVAPGSSSCSGKQTQALSTKTNVGPKLITSRGEGI